MSYIDRDRLAYFLSKLQLWVQNYAPSKSTATPSSDGLMSAADKAKLNGIVIDDAMNASSVNPVQNRAIAAAIQDLRSDLDDLAARAGSAYVYKGSVPTKADLPATGNQAGDVYDVLTAPDDGSWVWDGSQWNKMSGVIDLSGFATKDVATPSSDGLMSAADKASFDALMQGLVPLWSSLSDYPAFSLVRGSDGGLYYSQDASGPGTAAGARNPVDDQTGTYWSKIPFDDSGLVHVAGSETVSGQKTFSQPVVGDVLTAASGAPAQRLLSARAADSISPLDFGAVGDGATSDAAAFAALEAAYQGRVVDLLGKTYVVSATPTANYYVNGFFSVSGQIREAYGRAPLVHWNADSLTWYGVSNDELNYFIADGWSTPATVERARHTVTHLKDVIAIGAGAAGGAIRRDAYLVDCVALGSGVMSYGTMTSAAGHNIGIGEFALHRVTSGDRNIGIGSLSLLGLTTGRRNVAIGRDCCQGITSGQDNTAVGYCAMGAYGWNNVYGELDGQTKITGNYNVAVGAYAAHYLSGDSTENVAVGYNAALNGKRFAGSTAVGRGALMAAQYDTSINGKVLVRDTVSGVYSQSGNVITVNMPGHHAVAGCYVVISFTSGGIYSQSYLEYVNSVSGDSFTIVSSVANDTSGSCEATLFEQDEASDQSAGYNSAFGGFSFGYQKNVLSSVAIGNRAFCGDLSAESPSISYGVAVGSRTFISCTSSIRATGMGYDAAANAKSVNYSVVIGDYAALGCPSEITHSVIIGSSSANMIHSDHSGNTFVGALAADISGSMTRCTCIGYQSMYNANDANSYSGSTALGYNAKFTGDNQVQLGGYGSTAYAWGAVQNRSDARDKADVRDTALGLDFILSLRPVDYRWDCRDAYVDIVEDGKDENGDPVFRTVSRGRDGSRKRVRFHHGFLAQDVKAVMDAKGIDFGGYQDHKVNGGHDVLTLGYEEFIAPIVRALQELDARVKRMEA